MEINRRAPLLAHEELFIQAPPDVIWRLLDAMDSWSEWHPGVSEAKRQGPLAPGSTFYLKGGGLTWNATIDTVEPQRRLGWTGGTVGTHAIHQWELRPQDQGTLVVTEESLEGWLAQVFKVFKPRFLQETLATSLEALSKAAAGDKA